MSPMSGERANGEQPLWDYIWTPKEPWNLTQRLTNHERRERDERAFRRILWEVPLADVKLMMLRSNLKSERCYDVLKGLERKKQEVSEGMGWSEWEHRRYWLSANGVYKTQQETGWKIPWPVSESSLIGSCAVLKILKSFPLWQ